VKRRIVIMMSDLPFGAMLFKDVKTTSADIGVASRDNNDNRSRYPADRGRCGSRDECLNASRVGCVPQPLI